MESSDRPDTGHVRPDTVQKSGPGPAGCPVEYGRTSGLYITVGSKPSSEKIGLLANNLLNLG